MERAAHAEYNSPSSICIIQKLACSLVGKSAAVCIVKPGIAHEAYGQDQVMESFQCNYGLDESLRGELDDGNLSITGVDRDGQARIIEIPAHPFYLATLFLPQAASRPGKPHPLIRAFVEAAGSALLG